MFDLNNKTALITGASGGIGGAIAELFHKRGAFIVASGTNRDRLEELQKKLGQRSCIIPCNLKDRSDVLKLVEAASQINEGIDILICNAGITRDALALRMKDEDWDEVMEINLRSTFALNKEFCRLMMKKKWGRVINISSVVAFTGNRGQANYSASKGAIVSLTKTMALEFSSKNITVNCIAPGFIDTDMTGALNEKQKEGILSHIPLGVMGNGNDVAYGALYLASDEARYITGHSLHINGGMFMN